LMFRSTIVAQLMYVMYVVDERASPVESVPWDLGPQYYSIIVLSIQE
jgi:hypothetical protein